MGLLTERRCTSCSEFIAKSARDCPKCGAHDPFGNLAKDDVPSTSDGSGTRDYSHYNTADFRRDFPERAEELEKAARWRAIEAQAAKSGMRTDEFLRKLNIQDPAAERREEERFQAKEREKYFKEELPLAIAGCGLIIGVLVGCLFLLNLIFTSEMDPLLVLLLGNICLWIAYFLIKKISPND